MTGTKRMHLPAPEGGSADLLVLAGEHSGDEHAARMVAGLLARRPGVRVAAMGGPRLSAAGAQLLHDRTALSVVGILEVARNVLYFRDLIEATVSWIERHRPGTVCLVDNSGFNLRVAQALRERGVSRKGGGRVRLVYYISPQIWASRPSRRFEMARNLDALAVIFPFEVGCYADTGLPVEFVGHPFLSPEYAAPVRHDPAGPVLLLPGSRPKAVGLIMPALVGGYLAYAQRNAPRPAVVLHPEGPIRSQLEAMGLPEGVRLERAGTPVAASAVLTSSGTMSMHCALAGIPGAIAYRTDPFTYLIGRWLVNVPYLGIANILLGEPMYPEYLQARASPPALAAELSDCLSNPERVSRTREMSLELRKALSATSAGDAADWLIAKLG